MQPDPLMFDLHVTEHVSEHPDVSWPPPLATTLATVERPTRPTLDIFGGRCQPLNPRSLIISTPETEDVPLTNIGSLTPLEEKNERDSGFPSESDISLSSSATPLYPAISPSSSTTPLLGDFSRSSTCQSLGECLSRSSSSTPLIGQSVSRSSLAPLLGEVAPRSANSDFDITSEQTNNSCLPKSSSTTPLLTDLDRDDSGYSLDSQTYQTSSCKGAQVNLGHSTSCDAIEEHSGKEEPTDFTIPPEFERVYEEWQGGGGVPQREYINNGFDKVYDQVERGGTLPRDPSTVFHQGLPPDYMGMSVFSTICCFAPLGIAALYFSLETSSSIILGDYHMASKTSRRAQLLSIMAIILGTLAYTVALVVVATHMT
ncbi:proline-rich transmembrane protein 2-like isoform X2 [Branchiostoma lanceolatum]|uniref:proline-rich transmembrane protein 2-like isoform X2 n=1 Tax=Branchiostoma lanceolatum TaxID=7740 RepID=UPI003452EBB9